MKVFFIAKENAHSAFTVVIVCPREMLLATNQNKLTGCRSSEDSFSNI